MTPKPQRIAVVTSSRADYGHLYWPLVEMRNSPKIDLRLLVTGAHLEADYGHTVDVIRADGFDVEAEVPCFVGSKRDADMGLGIARATEGFTRVLDTLRPDALVVIADRYEMMGPALAAMACRIPIVHIEEGERSEGVIDQVVRDALTMMSHVHLTTTERAKARVIAMGVDPSRVHRVGAPSLDHLRRSRLWTRDELEAHLGFSLQPPPIIVGFHPVTLDEDPTAEADALYEVLEMVTEPIVFSFPNADFGSAALIERARAFCDVHSGAHVVVNLPPAGFWGLLQQAPLFLGNSSSGIMETPSHGVPCVNVGRRQEGRETAGNTVSVPADAEAIRRAMGEVGTEAFRARAAMVENPYGDGRAGERIVPILDRLHERRGLLGKRNE